MLVLTRKLNEKIVINNELKIEVIKIERNLVTLEVTSEASNIEPEIFKVELEGHLFLEYNVDLYISGVTRTQVKLSLDAPSEISINREELQIEINNSVK